MLVLQFYSMSCIDTSDRAIVRLSSFVWKIDMVSYRVYLFMFVYKQVL